MRLAERYLRGYYRYKFFKDWILAWEKPHWFDHRHDLFLWSVHRNAHWVERGVYAMEAMWSGCRVLDIGCGDGFYPYHFYATVASHIDAMDFDEAAIRHARRYHSHAKISYHVRDAVHQDFPSSRYDVVSWDGALAHFSWNEIQIIMAKIKAVIGTSGVLTGYEEIEQEERVSWDHKIALKSVGNLRDLLREYFPYVGTLQSYSAGRQNAYFRCSFDPVRLGRFIGEQRE